MKTLGNNSFSLMFKRVDMSDTVERMRNHSVPTEEQILVPLSSAQQLIWSVTQSNLANIGYNKSVTFKITGSLDRQVLESSFNYLAERHPVLRTRFTTIKGQPVQHISSRMRYTIGWVDYSNLLHTEAELTLNNYIEDQARRPIDLQAGPLIKPFLIHLSNQEYVFLLITHQIIFDNISTHILLEEIAEVYESICLQRAVSLPHIITPLVDYVSTQEENLTNTTFMQEGNYWTRQLSGELPILELPADYMRPAVSSYKGSAIHFSLDNKKVDLLKNLAVTSNATLQTILLTAYYTLLYRYTSQEDIIIGTQPFTRNDAESQNLVGSFTDMIPLRQQLYGDQTFLELLHIVKANISDAYQNRHISFEKILVGNHAQHAWVRHPMSQALFQMHDSSIPKFMKGGGLLFENYKPGLFITNFDLLLTISELEDTLCCAFEYDTDLFEPSTIQRLTGNFQILLESIISNPSAKISQLSILTSDERKQLLVNWNQTVSTYPDYACIHQLFEEQVTKSPDAVAVMLEDKQLTYAELNFKANQLAHYLRKKGVKPDMLVALCMERTIDQIVSLFAILKAGGAYLPLNPTMPLDYLNYTIEDAKASLLLTHTQLAGKLPIQGVETICLDTDWPVIGKEDTTNPEVITKPDNLAYIIYTSGSTGKPKGVMIEHKSLVNFSTTAIKTYEISSQDRILQFASISFDAAVEEIFPFLIQGSTLVLRNELMLSSISVFLKYCEEWEITVLDLPTAFFHLISSESNKPDFSLPPSLRLVLIGGERVLPEQVKLWQNTVGSFPKLINTYGPTESTVVVTTFDLSSFTLDATERIPIGYPIGNVKAYILDKQLQPVPIGVPGELHIGGAALARGYLNRAGLTAEKFIDNPFISGQKIYKTGDLVSYRPDGSIIYLGRIDNQVKIRGFRIELGEIETILNQHESIQDVVVIAREDTPGDKRVVAYIVTTGGIIAEEKHFKNYLKNKVPPYMVPSAIVQLSSFPLTVNGKINKKALPVPQQLTLVRDEYVAPGTEAEHLLSGIWTKILGQQQVGIHDNFFEIGGNSLLAIKLMAEIKRVTNLNLPLSWAFSHPTIHMQAQDLQLTPDPNVWNTMVSIKADGTKAPIYLVHDGYGGVEYGFQLSAFVDKDRPVYGFQVKGLNGVEEPLQTVEEMASYYIERLLAHQPNGPYHLAAYSGGAAIVYEIASQLKAKGKSVGITAIFDSYPENLSRFTYRHIGLRYVIQNIGSFIVTPELSVKQKLKISINELPEMIALNWKRVSKRAQEKKVDATNNPGEKIYRALRKAVNDYQFKYCDSEIIFVRSIENPVRYLRNCNFGWGNFAKLIRVYDLPGDHKALFRDKENLKRIAALLEKHASEHEFKVITEKAA